MADDVTTASKVRIEALEELTDIYLEAKANWESAREQIKRIVEPGEKITLPNGVKVARSYEGLCNTATLSAKKVQTQYPDVYKKCLTYRNSPSRLIITPPKKRGDE